MKGEQTKNMKICREPSLCGDGKGGGEEGRNKGREGTKLGNDVSM